MLGGHAAHAILDSAEGAELIIIGSHGLGGVRAEVIGSVADKVGRGSEIPVLFIPSAGDHSIAGIPTILIALDGSAHAARGLAVGRDFAGKLKAKVVIVRAWSYIAQYVVEPAYFTTEVMDAPKEVAEGYLAGVAAADERALAIEGYPPDAVESAAKAVDAGIVVLTTSGKGVGKRLFLGSTTDRLMHSLRRPLLIVPAHSE